MADETQGESKPFESLLSELESIVQKLESGRLGLEESVVLYSRGVALLNEARAVLNNAKAKVEVLMRAQEGDLTPQEMQPPKIPKEDMEF
jgi:exodeoxyribonuclease VII small subunit